MQSNPRHRFSIASFIGACTAFCLLEMIGSSAHAVTLVSSNSTIDVNPTQQRAISNWTVDGVGQLRELSNWYRVGSSGPERSVHTISAPVVTQIGPDLLTAVYSNTQFTIAIDYGVTGGLPGSGYGRMGEEIRITNNTANPLEFHFFEYVDLDLTNTPNDDVGTPLSPSGLRQTDGITVVNAGFLNYDHHEWDFFNATLTHLSNAGPGSTSLLNDNPAFGNTFPASGAGDITWALEWDFVGTSGPRPAIPAFQTAVITKHLECSYVPEPGSALLLAGLSLPTIGRRTRRI